MVADVHADALAAAGVAQVPFTVRNSKPFAQLS